MREIEEENGVGRFRESTFSFRPRGEEDWRCEDDVRQNETNACAGEPVNRTETRIETDGGRR